MSSILNSRGTNRHSWLVLAVCLLLGSVLYANSLDAPFYLDDFRNFVDNPSLRLTELSASRLSDVLTHSTIKSRPVSTISFALNYYFNLDHVAGYHVVNILIHVLTGFFLYQFAFATLSTPVLKSKYPDRFLIAMLTALIWLAHPLHTQSVTYIVQRMNSMAVMFYILSMWLYAGGRLHGRAAGSWKWFAGCTLAGLLALGSKEIAATLPMFIVLYEWYFFQDLNRQWLRRQLWIPAVLLLFGALLFIVYVDNPDSLLTGYARRPFTPYQRLLTEFRVVLIYVSLLVLPLPGRLNLDHFIPVSTSLFNPVSTVLSLAAIIILLVGSGVAARRHRLLSFAVFWYFGNLALESTILNLEIMFEHRTYLPSVFVIFAATASLWQLLGTRRRLAVGLAAIVIILFSSGTIMRNNVWRDPVAFWEDSVAKAPEKARPWINLSVAFRERGKFDLAIAAARRALEVDSRFVNGFVALATAYQEKGELDQAIISYQEVLRRMPDYADVYINLAKAYLQKGMIAEATAALQKCLQLDPSNYNALVNLASINGLQGRYGEAIAGLRKALEIWGRNPDVLFNLAVAYSRAGDPAAAIATYQQVLEINPHDREALRNLTQLRRNTSFNR